jgi:D-3-phosphoglycerate dehydrogenase / 2-oxoglutarate reductase
MRLHANDGMSAAAKQALEQAGFSVTAHNVAQDQLVAYLNAEKVNVLLVRSATKAKKDLIDACAELRLIGRGGVGMDNIDVAHARHKGLTVINTPAASSISVAELVMAHLFGLFRNLHKANRRMPNEGLTAFKTLKKEYEKGIELRGKTLGVIGFGRIGQWTARYALGAGMRVVYVDNRCTVDRLDVSVGGVDVQVPVHPVNLPELLAASDAISLHVPAQADGKPVLGQKEIAQMKKGAVVVNTARGGSVDEDALLAALASGHLMGAALDVFVGEPEPRAELLAQPALSLTPHIGAATAEAQGRIGDELVQLILSWRAQVLAER